MKINPPLYQNQASVNKNNYAQKVRFQSLLRVGSDYKKPLDSFFYRDVAALKKVKEVCTKYFPNGGVIIDEASSNGEELWSLFSLFKNPEKYKFMGVDISEDSYNLSKNGLYTVFSSENPDSFLLRSKFFLGREKRNLKNNFQKIFKPSDKVDSTINNAPEFFRMKQKAPFFKEHFFEVKDEYKNNVEFHKGDLADINKIDTEGEKVAAVLFRNAFYHILENNVCEEFSGQYVNTKKINRQALADDIINKIYHKLDLNGVFVLGNHSKDHYVLADEFSDPSNVIRVKDLKSYKNSLNSFKAISTEHARSMFPTKAHYLEAGRRLMQVGESSICKKSPIQIALERNGRFKPIMNSPVRIDSKFIDEGGLFPVVWQKVK